MKTLLAMFFTIAASNAFAASDVTAARTGVPLDVAKTISITDISDACGVVPVELTYEDSQGQRHSVSYQVIGDGCHN
ncbi:MAG: DUF2790 domain-containing protein [Pseudomonas sp.]